MIEKEQLEQLVEQGKSTYAIAVELRCSQTNIRHHLRKHGLQTNLQNANPGAVCLVCQQSLRGKQRKFCSRDCKTLHSSKLTNNCYEYQQKRGQARKLKLINMLGGQCSVCGYNRNHAALAFHHRNPETKAFTLDMRSCSNRSWEKVLAEAEKCELMCHNCHAEHHYPHYGTT